MWIFLVIIITLMSQLSRTPAAHADEQTTGSRIASWSRMAVFVSALSATPACAPTLTPHFSTQPEQPNTTQVQQTTPQLEVITTQETTAATPKSPGTQVEHNSDSESMLVAVINDPMLLNKVDPALRNDRDFINVALEKTTDPSVLIQVAPQWVYKDKEMMMTALKRNIHLLQFADDSLKNDQLFMMRAILIDGQAIKYASENLRNDRAMAIAAVTQNGRSDRIRWLSTTQAKQ
jgi:hypothetical protein